MELRTYWNVVTRWWWIIALVTIGVGAASVLLQPETRETYASTAKAVAFATDTPYRGGSFPPAQNDYYEVLLMELFWDDMGPVVKSGEFMEHVRRDLTPFAGGRAVSGGFDTKKEHRTMTITATSDSPEIAQRMANTAVKLLQDGGPYEGLIKSKKARVQLATPAEPGYVASRVGGAANLGLRVLLGLIAGVALAFLLDYLDDSIRTTREAQDTLGMPVLGEIPALR